MSDSGIKSEEIILKGVHCPYCGSDDAVLISRTEEKKYALQRPEYGLKFMLSVLYLGFIYIWRHGFKLFELKRNISTTTFAFCPHCGKSYELKPDNGEKEKQIEEKYRRSRNRKLLAGVCAGMHEYTGISLGWIRFVTIVFAGLWIVPYILIAIFVPFKEV